MGRSWWTSSKFIYKYLLSYLLIQLIDPCAILCWCSMELCILTGGELLASFHLHLFSLNIVHLARHYCYHYSLLLHLVRQLLNPVIQRFKGVLIGGVIYKADGICSLVVDGCQGTELLTTCRIPNLQLSLYSFENAIGLNLNGFSGIVCPQGRLRIRELILHISVHNTSFTDTCISQHDNLVYLLFWCCHLLLNYDSIKCK